MRKTTSVIAFYIWFTASANLIESVGVAENLGIETTVTVGDSLTRSVDGLNQIQAGGVSAESVMGLYVVATGVVQSFLVGLTAGPRLLVNVGIPLEFVVFLHAPVGLLAGRMLLYALAQRDL